MLYVSIRYTRDGLGIGSINQVQQSFQFLDSWSIVKCCVDQIIGPSLGRNQWECHQARIHHRQLRVRIKAQ